MIATNQLAGNSLALLRDAIIFEVMRRERITRALTFDHHFAVAGFTTLR